jgi:hypothetical protein
MIPMLALSTLFVTHCTQPPFTMHAYTETTVSMPDDPLCLYILTPYKNAENLGSLHNVFFC